MKIKLLSVAIQIITSYIGNMLSNKRGHAIKFFREGQRKIIMDELREAERVGNPDLIDYWEQKLVIFLKNHGEYYE